MKPGDSWRATLGGSSSARLYTWEWAKEARAFLVDHPLCVRCDKAGRVALAVAVDHRVPHRGDLVLFWDRANWDGLCAHCHNSEKQKEEWRERYGR